jgi:nicotinamidase-related amidase
MATHGQRRELPVPPHFDSSKVGEVWRVPYQQLAAAARDWARAHDLPPAAADQPRVCLMAVDTQNTFCIPGFELFVGGQSGRGAVDDNTRLCRFIYRNLGVLTEIVATLDTHRLVQIFHPFFLVDANGDHPQPMTVVSVEDVESGRWRVNPAAADSIPGRSLAELQRHLLHYCRRLRERGKYSLMIWPYHAMLGGIGHALVSSIEEAIFFHAVARRTEPAIEIKGDKPLTEHYSVLGPEVRDTADGAEIGRRNTAFVDRLLAFDAVIIAGEAKSHCVAWTIEDLIEGIDRDLARKVYLLEDCTSPVVVPGAVDFTDEANRAFGEFEARGVHLVRSTDPLATWPAFPTA